MNKKLLFIILLAFGATGHGEAKTTLKGLEQKAEKALEKRLK